MKCRAPQLIEKPRTVQLKQKDRILFFGDSITQSGTGPSGYVTLVTQDLVHRHANLKLEVLAEGASGNKISDLLARIEKDVLAKQPSIVVIYAGTDDAWHGENDPSRATSIDAFEKALVEIVEKCREAKTNVVLCTPTVIGEKSDGMNKLDTRLNQYSDVIRKIAKDFKLPLCDLRQAFVERLKAVNKNENEEGILTFDRVHLNKDGNKLVADSLLKLLAP